MRAMYVILVYDVNVKRVTKILKIVRRYLNWVQNSVCEGEISQAGFEKLKAELKSKINEKEDSAILYTLRTAKYSKRELTGKLQGV